MFLNRLLVVLIALVLSSPAEAQQLKRVPRVGYISGRAEPSRSARDPSSDAFRKELRDLGFIEGNNILIELRYAAGKQDRSPRLVQELLQLKVDVIVSPYSAAIRAAKQATNTIPIIMVTNVDPVATGIVDNLARPVEM